MRIRRFPCAAAVAAMALLGVLAAPVSAGSDGDVEMKRTEPIRFGAETLFPDDERTHFSRAVNFAPADGQVVDLDPPRFRWQYHPAIPGEGGDYIFTFQVAADADFESLLVDVETEFNFYNTIAPFEGEGPFYWRIGYRERRANGAEAQWGQTRSFTMSGDARRWDRSPMANPDFASKGHPRILFNKESLIRLRELVKTDPECRAIFENMRRDADAAVSSEWWSDFPQSDAAPAPLRYIEIADSLVKVAFVWRVTDDARYSGVKSRALTMARYPRGGRFSPQGAGGEAQEDSTQSTEFMGLLYDWLYQDFSEAECREFAACLDWRIDHFVNAFAWRRPDGGRLVVREGSLSTFGGSHPFEGFFHTFPAAVAAYEDSPAARQCFHLGVNYMVGVGSAHGFDEGWNEGPGYGNSKWSWQVNSLSYLDSVFPEYEIGANPWLIRMGEFLRSQTPVGLKHAPWGHGSNNSSYYERGHQRAYRKLAFVTGDGRFLANWAEYAKPDGELDRPWIECALGLWRERPKPVVEEKSVRVFPLGGWVTALSGPPSDPATYAKGVGMIFASRPAGGHSHSFCLENSFHIFAYGQDVTHAGGTSDYTPYSFHTMSHNTILVDGLGQATPRFRQETPYCGRLTAFGEKDAVVYWCGDATLAYPRKPLKAGGWWGSLSDIYEKRDLSYVTRVNRHVLFVRNKYFVILDDLEADRPARWSWLYHVLEGDMDLDRETGSFKYVAGDVEVFVTHLLGRGECDIVDLQGQEGYANPLTGEDYSSEESGRRRSMVAEHNVWMTTRQPHESWRYLAVVSPVPPGGRPPTVERLDDLTLRIDFGGQVDIISFDADTRIEADIVVDLDAIRPAGVH